MQAPQWWDYPLCCVCKNQFNATKKPISLPCGHSLCTECTGLLRGGPCPLDQSPLLADVSHMPTNFALLVTAERDANPGNFLAHSAFTERVEALIDSGKEDLQKSFRYGGPSRNFLEACKRMGEVAEVLFPCDARQMMGSHSSSAEFSDQLYPRFTKPMHKKIATLIQCQMSCREGRMRLMKHARVVAERACMELVLLYQKQAALANDLWQHVKKKSCQFLGHQLQEEVLKVIFMVTCDGHQLQRKTLIDYVLQQLGDEFEGVSRTNVGHVVQLMFRAQCFHVGKDVNTGMSVLTLLSEIQSYAEFRTRHDSQVAAIAQEQGLFITPEYFSLLLYSSTNKRAHMQSVMDKLITGDYLQKTISRVYITSASEKDEGDRTRLLEIRRDFEKLEAITAIRKKKAAEGVTEKDDKDLVESPSEEDRSYCEVEAVLDSVARILNVLVKHTKGYVDSSRKGKGMPKSGGTGSSSGSGFSKPASRTAGTATARTSTSSGGRSAQRETLRSGSPSTARASSVSTAPAPSGQAGNWPDLVGRGGAYHHQMPTQTATRYPPPSQAATRYPPPSQAAARYPPPSQAAAGYPPPSQAAARYPPPSQAAARYPPPSQAAARYPPPSQAATRYPPPSQAATRYPPPPPGAPAPPANYLPHGPHAHAMNGQHAHPMSGPHAHAMGAPHPHPASGPHAHVVSGPHAHATSHPVSGPQAHAMSGPQAHAMSGPQAHAMSMTPAPPPHMQQHAAAAAPPHVHARGAAAPAGMLHVAPHAAPPPPPPGHAMYNGHGDAGHYNQTPPPHAAQSVASGTLWPQQSYMYPSGQYQPEYNHQGVQYQPPGVAHGYSTGEFEAQHAYVQYQYGLAGGALQQEADQAPFYHDHAEFQDPEYAVDYADYPDQAEFDADDALADGLDNGDYVEL